MKIGILTQPLTTNYGGILQNYAMQQVLKSLGHEAVTIRIAHTWQGLTCFQFWKVYPKYVVLFLLQLLKGQKSKLPEPIWTWRKRVVGIESFIKKHIHTTPFVRGNDLCMCDIYKNNIEALLIGSDQVWHGGLPYMTNVYFCGFAKENKIRRVAYAASFGFDIWRGNEVQTTEARELIQKFYSIGVREEIGVTICRDALHRNDAKWVLDPTLLINKEEYNKLCADIAIEKESFVFAYILDMTDEKKNLAERVGRLKGCKVKYISVKKVSADDRIEKWISMFRDTKFVVTDSYHGTVFSLIYRKDFLCVYNPERGNSRMDSLKKITGLDDRFIVDSSGLTIENINYDVVSNRIDNMRSMSFSFLFDALH